MLVTMISSAIAFTTQTQTKLRTTYTARKASLRDSDTSDFDLKKNDRENVIIGSAQSLTLQVHTFGDAIQNSLIVGGKRISPGTMCAAAYEMLKGSQNVAIITALAFEAMHPMLAGGTFLSTSFDHLAEITPSSIEPDQILDLVSRLGKQVVGAEGLAGVQVINAAKFEGNNQDETLMKHTLNDSIWIEHSQKTAALLQAVTSFGNVLGEAIHDEMNINPKFAFQVADDVNGVSDAIKAFFAREHTNPRKPEIVSLLLMFLEVYKALHGLHIM